MDVKIVSARSGKEITTLSNLNKNSTIDDVKQAFAKTNEKYYPDRQSFKSEPRGKSLKGDTTLESLAIGHGDKLYFKDLGPQISWTTVFICEYAGPLLSYAFFYLRPGFIYGDKASDPRHYIVNLAMACWSFHYLKRILETLFVHRFSHATMPISNLFKNVSYYAGNGAAIGYFVNHPLYTPPSLGDKQVYFGLAMFMLAEYGNFCIHIALRDLRPPGTKERRIPFPNSNPMTSLFNFVSCPNYTYEVFAWIGFGVMTQCLTVGIFLFLGTYQMFVWALGKHRNYRKEFKDYPKGRKAMFPFLA